MNELLPIILSIVVGLAVIGGLIPVFIKARRNSQNYTGPRDANDPAPLDADSQGESQGGGTLVQERPETQVPPSDLDILEPQAPSIETPLPVEGRLVRLRERLSKSNNALGKGLLALLSSDNIDEVIAIIRASSTPDEAREGLIKRFELSDLQARAIVEMRLRQLTGLEQNKLRNEYADVMQQIEHFKNN